MREKNIFNNLDIALLISAFLVFLIGCLAVYSATQSKELPFNESYFLRQITWVAIGAILLMVAIAISYQKFIDISYFLYVINIVLLVVVLALGRARLGAQRWFSIGSFAFQPSEFIKLSLILVLANYVGFRKDAMESLKSLFFPCVLMAIPFVLVLAQPDLGSAILLLPIFFSILLIGGTRFKYIIGIIAVGFVSLPIFFSALRDYQRERLFVFINPNIDPLGAGYTIIQSKIAVGSGGLLGKGWLNGTQNQLNFLPERHTDFIFSVVGEEWGFLGAAALLILYFLIIRKALDIARLTSDMYGKLIATGIAMMLAMQVIINIGMTIGLMPVVGIPLPLVSYGGSSLIATLVAIGLLMNVSIRRTTF